MVEEVFHSLGVIPVTHMAIIRCRRALLKESGMMRMSSLGTPSGPGLLLFRSFLMTVENVCSLITSGKRVVYSVRWDFAGVSRVKGSRQCGDWKGKGSFGSMVWSSVHCELK